MNNLQKFHQRHIRFLKQQLKNLKDEKNSLDPRPRIEQEVFAADKELKNYLKQLKEAGFAIH
jgi:hypothetical protein